jgi:protein N-lysine methyltransferase METTL21D
MSDVAYNTASFPSLLRTLKALIHLPANTTPPMILLGYKERDRSERTLWDLAWAECKVRFEKRGERRGAGGCSVEVWLGVVTE